MGKWRNGRKEEGGSSRGRWLDQLAGEFKLDAVRDRASRDELLEKYVINPENRWYRQWWKFIVFLAAYSSIIAPLEFGFFRRVPRTLFFIDTAGNFFFLADVVVQFLLAYRDPRTYRLVSNPTSIALRYLKSGFFIDILTCFPWNYFYQVSGGKEHIRYLLWARISRVVRVMLFFQNLEKDIRFNYLSTRILKLLFVQLYSTHTAACIFYYLATTLPESLEDYTWIGSLKLGQYSYEQFRSLDLYTRYTTSLYFTVATMSTVGYGDIHAVNSREMVFVIIYITFNMLLGTYLIGNMTALIVKVSKTEKFRDEMKDVVKYMNNNKLGKDISNRIKAHLRLKYDISYTETSALQDVPASIRSKITENLYKPHIEKTPLFRGCSIEFIHQIVIKLREEYFLPGEVIMEQGDAVDHIYFVCHGLLEGIAVGEDGFEEIAVQIVPNYSFGEIAILCNIPQPYTVRASELSRLLRLDKQFFTSILQLYFIDRQTILHNLLEGKDFNLTAKQLVSDIVLHVEKQDAELTLRLNGAVFHGDFNHLKCLIQAGADPKKTDYDGRSPLHLAAARGFEDIASFLIQKGVDINLSDRFGNTPLLEAIKHGHDEVASLLFKGGARLDLNDAGSHLCMLVARGESDLLRRMLSYGIDPNSKDYDHRTPLHIAAAEGLEMISRMLLESGANVFEVDRWGRTPLDEAERCGRRSLMMLLTQAKGEELSDINVLLQEIQGETQAQRFTSISTPGLVERENNASIQRTH